MTILEKAVMLDGTEIQLEDWSEQNTEKFPNLYGLEIGTYPIAKKTNKYKLVKDGQKFRLSISVNNYSGYTNDNVKADFEALKSGEKKIEDLSKHFWNSEKDMWYLGMNVENKNY